MEATIKGEDMNNIVMPELPGLVNDIEAKIEDVVTIITQMILGESVMVNVSDLEKALSFLTKMNSMFIALDAKNEELEELIESIESRIDLYYKISDKYKHLIKDK